MLPTLILLMLLTLLSCGVFTEATETTREVPTPSSGRYEAIILEVLEYDLPVKAADVKHRGDTLHLTVTVEHGTSEDEADAVLDHAFDVLEVADEARDFNLGINIQYPDGQMIVSMAVDRPWMFNRP